jgi:hypothetical protein
MSSIPPSLPSLDVAYTRVSHAVYDSPWAQLTQRTMAKLFTPRMLAGFKLHCREWLIMIIQSAVG